VSELRKSFRRAPTAMSGTSRLFVSEGAQVVIGDVLEAEGPKPYLRVVPQPH